MARTEVTGSQIKDGTVSLTADVTGTLTVGNGGTGSTTLALNNVLLGNGTGALQAVAPGTSGNVLTSNGTTWSSAALSLASKTLSDPTFTGTITGAADATTVGSGKVIRSGVLDTYPENAGFVHIPMLYNDLAYNNLRGGSTTVTLNGSAISPAESNMGLAYNNTGLFILSPTATTDTYVITVNTHTTFRYGTYWGIVMGDAWRAKDVTIEIYYSGAWTTIHTVTNHTSGSVWKNAGSGANDVTAVRFTLTNLNSASLLRISSIFAVNYASGLATTGYLPRGLGAVYGTTALPPTLTATGSDTNIDLSLVGKGSGGVRMGSIKDTNGNTAATIAATASAVNYFQITNGAAGSGVSLFASGSDTNISANIYGKGTGPVNLRSNTNGVAFQAVSTASGVNYLAAYSQVTGAAPTLYAVGSDTNINLNLQPAGSGVVQAKGVEVATISGTQTLTSKTISGASNTLSNIAQSSVTNLTTDLAAKEATANKGVANGYASLDSGGKVPVTQLPSSIMEYQGVWNASTNTPTLANGTGSAGDVYRVSVAGTSLSLTFDVGDYVIYNGTTWEKSDTTDAVASVAGKTGNVTLTSTDVGLGNVDNTSNATERAATATLTNKTIALGSNTVSGTLAQFNTAVTDADLARTDAANTFTGVQTMTSPALTTPTITGAITGTYSFGGTPTWPTFNQSTTGTAAGLVPAKTTTAAASTITLTSTSATVQEFTHSGSATLNLPTTGVVAGQTWTVMANGTGTVSVYPSSGGGGIITLGSSLRVGTFTARIDTPTANADWIYSVISSASSLNTIVQRDVSSNIIADNFIATATSTATAAGTTTLGIDSTQIQIFTGTTTQTVLLPTTSVAAGQTYTIINQSTGSVAVQSSAAALIATVPAGCSGDYTALVATPTTAAHWRGAVYQNTSGVIPLTGNTLAAFAQSTTNAIGVGTVELGHASDTTLSRASAGQLAVEGVNVLMTGGALGTPASGTLTNCTFPTLNQNTTGSAATLTTGRTVQTSLSSTSSATFDGSANITPGVTGTLAVGNGGTGSTTLTANNVLLGNGTSALQEVAPGTTGNVLTSNGTTWTSAAPTGGSSVPTFTTTATAAGTTTLTTASNEIQEFTGSTTQTVVLPTTSIVAGRQFTIMNNSTGLVTIQSSSLAQIHVLAPGTESVLTALVATPTLPAHWEDTLTATSYAAGKSLTVNNSLTLAGTDGTTMTFPSTNATIARTDAANTFTGVQTVPSLVATNTTGTVATLGTATATATATPVMLDLGGTYGNNTAGTTGNLKVKLYTGYGFGVSAAPMLEYQSAAGSTHNFFIGGTNYATINTAGITAANLFSSVTSTATAAGTTTLTVTSNGVQAFTGSTTQTVTLPTTSVGVGMSWTVVNNSTGAVTVQSSGANAVLVVNPSTAAVFTALVATPTTAAHWTAAATDDGDRRLIPRIGTTTSTATPSIDCGLYDQYNITALAAAITSITITGTPTDGQKLMLRIKDNGTIRAIAWSSAFTSSGIAILPTTTIATKTHLIGLLYDSVAVKWVCVAADATGY